MRELVIFAIFVIKIAWIDGLINFVANLLLLFWYSCFLLELTLGRAMSARWCVDSDVSRAHEQIAV